ncbi:Anaphase-promoting complex, cyclosome, subunit 3 [Phycisphaerae bacterium RAS1]|nr:Anaphase-promoting complex, cyclosome, subunit 3 [Phycisphaerae bacterium RAS1]
MLNRHTLQPVIGALLGAAASVEALGAAPPTEATCYVMCRGGMMPAVIVSGPLQEPRVSTAPFVRVLDLSGAGLPRERLVSAQRLRNIQRDLDSQNLREYRGRYPRMVSDVPHDGGFAGGGVNNGAIIGGYGGVICDGYGAPFAFEDSFIARRLAAREDARRAFNTLDMAERKAKLLTAHEKTLKTGVGLLASGEYQKALMVLSLASELNQGDPACRVHLAQARLALGHYDEAGRALRRALQLQPKLLYVPLNLSETYPQPDVFDRHVDGLRDWTAVNEASADVMLLLAYMEMQRGDYAAAHAASRRVAREHPKDELARTVSSLTRPAR